jgi:hypothetical protein
MAERQIDASKLAVTPNWLADNAKPAPVPGQPAQPQQPVAQQAKPDHLGSAAKLFGNQAVKSGFFGAGGAATGINGAATGATSATGGTYVTGSGLAGTASPINTVAGAAGKTAGGGFAAGIKTGIGSLAAGVAGGFIGDKLFGGHGGTGGSIGASIGFAMGGPLGALAGSLFGGAFGGMFGGGEKRAFLTVVQGGGAHNQPGTKRNQTINTDLGRVSIGTDNIPASAVSQIGEAFKTSDAQVAQLFSESQLSRAKAGIENGPASRPHADWGQPKNADRAEGAIKEAFRDRYALAVGGLDPQFYGTFKRVADDKSLGGAVSTFAALDNDIQSKQGIFADFQPAPVGQLISADDPRIQKTITQRVLKSSSMIPTYENKTVTNPKYNAALANQFASQQSGRQIIGYKSTPVTTQQYVGIVGPKKDVTTNVMKPIYEEGVSGVGDQALQHIANKHNLGNRPPAPKLQVVPEPTRSPMSNGIMNTAAIRDATNANKAKTEEYTKQLKAWETKVLDTYADSYQQTPAAQQANNMATLGVKRDQATSAQGQSVPTRTKLFGNISQQEVKLNRATPTSNASTNAGGLLSQAGVM